VEGIHRVQFIFSCIYILITDFASLYITLKKASADKEQIGAKGQA